MVSRIWRFLTTELNWKQTTEVTKTAADTGNAVLNLGEAIQEKKGDLAKLSEGIAPYVKPYVNEISSLLDVLNSPIAQVVKEAIPFAPIAVTMMQLICEGAKREPTLEECVALMSQVAYLESLRDVLGTESGQALVAWMDDRPVTKQVQRQI
jgi:hypothetical protein